MDPEQFRSRFPSMRPLAKAPALFRVNGCGLGLYGRRDVDRETGTCVRTRCLCLAFVPLLAIDAYRVADADRGWHFIGRERLSPVALAWDVLACAGLAFAIFWGGTRSTSNRQPTGPMSASTPRRRSPRLGTGRAPRLGTRR